VRCVCRAEYVGWRSQIEPRSLSLSDPSARQSTRAPRAPLGTKTRPAGSGAPCARSLRQKRKFARRRGRALACEAIPHPTRKRPFYLQIDHMRLERPNSSFTEFACVSREFGPLKPASGPFRPADRALPRADQNAELESPEGPGYASGASRPAAGRPMRAPATRVTRRLLSRLLL
jgi:hypothetical protein